MHLNELPRGTPAYVTHIDWDRLSLSEGQRLREFGICEGASVELAHRGGLFGGGAIAARIGRMTVAMRSRHASAISVSLGVEPLPATDPSAGTALAFAE